MTARDWLLTLTPGLVLLAAGTLWPGQERSATAAVLLTTPWAVGTAWLTRWLSMRYTAGGIPAMAIGVVVRGSAAVGGGALVFFASGWFEPSDVGFWAWLIAAYLSTLAAEVVALARPSARPTGGAARKG